MIIHLINEPEILQKSVYVEILSLYIRVQSCVVNFINMCRLIYNTVYIESRECNENPLNSFIFNADVWFFSLQQM